MKIVVIGGTGLIGSKTTVLLRAAGHDALAAAPNTGVNTATGEGLEAALDAAEVVIDLANSPSFESSAVMAFFTAHEKNLLAAEDRAGVRHHVALSIVGVDRSPDSGYFRAKVFQEELIKGWASDTRSLARRSSWSSSEALPRRHRPYRLEDYRATARGSARRRPASRRTLHRWWRRSFA